MNRSFLERAGAQVTVPANYLTVQTQAEMLKVQLQNAARSHDSSKLLQIITQLKGLRHSIATISPDIEE